jgi:magnesium transporter
MAGFERKPREILQKSLQEVKRLLSRQQVVEDLTHRQEGPKQSLVENVVHKQNLAELARKLEHLHPADIAAIIDSLPHVDRDAVIGLIGVERLGYVLLELTGNVRMVVLASVEQPMLEAAVAAMEWEELVRLLGKLPAERLGPLLEDMEPEKREELRAALSVQQTPIDSIKAFVLQNGRLVQLSKPTVDDILRPEVIWLDMVDPTLEERELVEKSFRVELPEDEEMEDIEESARCYMDDSGIHISSFFLHKGGDETDNVTVSFTLNQDRLVTIRQEELAVFRLFRLRARMQPGLVSNPQDILLTLFELAVEYDADMLEEIYTDLEPISQRVLKSHEEMTDKIMAETVAELAKYEDINGKVRLDLMDTRRALSFLLRSRQCGAEQEANLREILRDLESLNNHSAFLFDKINFLMDAVMGLINLAQNKIIKMFSVAAVMFMPPTLVASWYGMNFRFMPALEQPWGYPFAIGLMVTSVLLTLWYFNKKRWL